MQTYMTYDKINITIYFNKPNTVLKGFILMEIINQIDMFFVNFMLDIRNSTLSFFMAVFSAIGNSGVCWIVICALLLAFRRTRKIGVITLICLITEWILNDVVLKNLFCRQRPFETYPWITTVITPPSGFSFPSGHSASSFACATAIYLQNKKFGKPAFVLAFLIAFSRMYFCVHYFTDVLIGCIFGVLVSLVIVKVIYPHTFDSYKCNIFKSKKGFVLSDGFTCAPISDEIFSKINGISFKENTKIKRNMLHYIKVKYIDFNGAEQTGELIANRLISKRLLRIFKKLYKKGYEIEKIRLIDEYGANDEKSMEDNNSSAFCYRTIANTDTLSNHAKGLAVDINPLYNPYIQNGKVLPPSAQKYADRTKDFPHKLDKYDYCVRLFKSYGFEWGGDWTNGSKDYQHFDINIKI